MLNLKRVAHLFVLFLGSSAEALACPLCHTGTGQQVREGILSSDLYFNLFAAIAPFPVLAAIVAFFYYGPDL